MSVKLDKIDHHKVFNLCKRLQEVCFDKNLSERDVQFLYDTYRSVRPTEKQLKYLKDLGYTEKVKTKYEASELIKELTGE